MTQEFQGEVLFEGFSGTTAADWVYTTWQPARGAQGVYAVDVIAISGLTLTWAIETKESEEPDSSSLDVLTANVTASSSGVSYAGVGQSTAQDIDAKQLVRFKFATGGTASLDSVCFRALPISWQTN